MELTLQELGNRLKALRLEAQLSQDEVAQQLGASQNLISRMEKGEGGSLNLLLSMINFYKTLFNLNGFWADEFHTDGLRSTSLTPLQSVAMERLTLFKQESEKELEAILRLLGK